ncbi:protoporphyrinogen oxidase [Occallatibacter savannae]|uniref:protoporphyrinogen oxidase n=1 Tax=Occallatibacter savannae TaxID=1002691 RepID=UPI000D68A017|nr:protoporphyrinogen oxidase [Occallatibacter savannae]
MRVAIIGGGIAGLAAAYELEKARSAGADIAYTLFESRDRLGGSLASETANGVVLERGPDSFLSEKPAGAELCRELGLGDQLVPSNDANRKTYIVVKNKLVPLPDGLMFLIPTKLVPTALTSLFSPATKIKMALELLHPPRPSENDESVAALVERHFGKEAVDRLADPLLSGIYGGDATQLSARTVLPKLVEMETQYGSLTRGMLAAHKQMRAKMAAMRAAAGNGTAGQGSAKPAGPRSIFTSLKGGMQQLVDALEARLNPEWIRKSAAVAGLLREDDSWRLQTSLGEEQYDAVILASQAFAAGKLLATTDAALADELCGIPYSSSITVNLVFDESQLGPLPDGFGFLVPAVEGRAMLACTFVHRKFAGRTPTGKAVLRAFLGGAKNEALLDQSDDVLIATVRRELSEILGTRIVGPHIPAEATQVSRWRRAMAQYAVGHQERMKRVKKRVAALPGLRLAGNAYEGIGIPDCIRTGRNAAKELVAERQLSATRS